MANDITTLQAAVKRTQRFKANPLSEYRSMIFGDVVNEYLSDLKLIVNATCDPSPLTVEVIRSMVESRWNNDRNCWDSPAGRTIVRFNEIHGRCMVFIDDDNLRPTVKTVGDLWALLLRLSRDTTNGGEG